MRAAKVYCLLNTTDKSAADDAFVDKLVADFQPPLAARCASRADVPVPQGERSIARSP